MKYSPLVSIVIPVYNGSNYLGEAIDSALAQTYENVEVIVVNDGSKDNGDTEKVALSYGERIRYFCKENGGVSSALNLGIKEMRGEYFSWLSHDDKYEPTKIQKQIELLKGLDRKNVCAICSCREIDYKSDYLGNTIHLKNIVSERIYSADEMLKYLLKEQSLNGCAILVPKDILDNIPQFDEELRYNQDYKMWINICLAGYDWIYSNDLGVYSRVHSQQVTQTRRDLMHKDSITYGKELLPKLASVSTNDNNYLYLYTLRQAKYNIKDGVTYAKTVLKQNKLCNPGILIRIDMSLLWGGIRPAVRRIYYKLFKRVKTK